MINLFSLPARFRKISRSINQVIRITLLFFLRHLCRDPLVGFVERRQIDGDAGLRFWPGRQRRLWWRGLWAEERRAWRYGATAILIPRRGCYAFQVDGATFSRRIVFAVS